MVVRNAVHFAGPHDRSDSLESDPVKLGLAQIGQLVYHQLVVFAAAVLDAALAELDVLSGKNSNANTRLDSENKVKDIQVAEFLGGLLPELVILPRIQICPTFNECNNSVVGQPVRLSACEPLVHIVLLGLLRRAG